MNSGFNLSGRGGRRTFAAAVVVALTAGILAAVAAHYAKEYFLFSPGTAPVITTSTKCKAVGGEMLLPGGRPCVHLVVPAGRAHKVAGTLLMVDVEESTPGPLQWAEYQLGLLGKQHELIPVSDYTGGLVPPSELGCQDDQEMASADQDAAVAALSSLHYRVSEVPLGAEVTAVLPGTPAWRAGIHCNDLITAVDGARVTSAGRFSAVLAQLGPGKDVVLTEQSASGGPPKKVHTRLAVTPPARVKQGFPASGYLGVSVLTRQKPVLPFKVSIEAGDIGGPSAGLAFALAIIDALSNGRLTRGHVVAATGTISPAGDVGDVGGVREKAVAVEKAGAQIFFVPAAEYANAESTAGKRLRVIPVSSLRQVLKILHRLYGSRHS